MMDCPSAEQLRNLVEQGLSADETARVSKHVEDCPSCHQVLDKITATPDVPQHDPTSGQDLPEVLDRLVRQGPSGPPSPETNDEDSSLQPLPRLDGFEIERELGRGGMGVVYLARQTALDRQVAVKVIAASGLAGQSELGRFRTESTAVARLQHPNIVQIFEVGDTDAQPYVVLEYVEGQTLSEHTASRPQETRWAAALVKTLAEAVEHAHGQYIIHRDLKPSNILLTERGEPKITDFGLAKILDDGSGTTHSGELLGTPSYMAPEQAIGKGGEIGPETDVYALGAVLYELLVGRPPFTSESVVDTVVQVVHQEPIPPRAFRKLPRDLETICLKCLRKEPSRRFTSARELAADLERFLTGKPIVARRVGWPTRAAKWVRRYPARASLLTLAMLALIGIGIAGSYFQFRRQQLETRVSLAVDAAEGDLSEAKWQQAQAAVDRCRDLLDNTTRMSTQAARVSAVERDLVIVRQLESILLEQADTNIVKEKFDRLAVGPRYHDAFSDYGIVAGETSVEAAARLVRGRPQSVRKLLIAALDNWTNVVQSEQKPWEWHYKVIEQADPDRWRGALRAAMADRDQEALKQLAADEAVPDQPPATIHLLAVGLQRSGLITQTVEVLRIGQRATPQDFWLNHDLAWALNQLRPVPHAEVVRYFSIAVALRPRSAGARVNLGMALFRQGNLAEAEAEFRMATQLEPGYATAHTNLAHVLNSQEKYEQAMPVIEVAIRLSPNRSSPHLAMATAAYRLRQYDKALEHSQRAIELDAKSVNSHYFRAMTLMALDKYREAVNELLIVTKLTPKDAEAHYNLGVSYRRLKQDDKAADAYRMAIKHDPQDPKSHSNLAIILREKKLYDEAVRHMSLAVKAAPKDPRYARGLKTLKRVAEAHAALAKTNSGTKTETKPTAAPKQAPLTTGLDKTLTAALRKEALDCLRRAGRREQLRQFDKAKLEYERVLEIDPQHVPSLIALAGISFDAEKKPARALELLDKALKLAPGHWRAETFRGIIRWSQGDHTAGEESFRAAIKAAPQQYRPPLELAQRLRTVQRTADAAEVLETAIKAIPKSAELLAELSTIYYDRGVALHRSGKLQPAQKEFRKVLEIRGEDYRAFYNLGLIDHQQNHYDKAVEWYRKAIKAQPTFPEAHCNLGHVLMKQKLYKEALPHFERGHVLGKKLPRWRYPSQQWVERCKKQIAASQ